MSRSEWVTIVTAIVVVVIMVLLPAAVCQNGGKSGRCH